MKSNVFSTDEGNKRRKRGGKEVKRRQKQGREAERGKIQLNQTENRWLKLVLKQSKKWISKGERLMFVEEISEREAIGYIMFSYESLLLTSAEPCLPPGKRSCYDCYERKIRRRDREVNEGKHGCCRRAWNRIGSRT